LSEDNLDEGRRSAGTKQLDRPVRLISVGVETEKAAARASAIRAPLVRFSSREYLNDADRLVADLGAA
jgi:hypothetical protein